LTEKYQMVANECNDIYKECQQLESQLRVAAKAAAQQAGGADGAAHGASSDTLEDYIMAKLPPGAEISPDFKQKVNAMATELDAEYNRMAQDKHHQHQQLNQQLVTNQPLKAQPQSQLPAERASLQ
ncbi:unnamed protein product, partial [Prorocentrum cordatum]